MVTINLLPIKAELRQRALVEHILVLIICLVATFVVLGFVQGAVKQQREDLHGEIAQTKVEIKKLTAIAGEIEQFKKQRQELERKLEIISDLNTQKTGPVEMLDQLSIIIPEKAWIKSLNNTGHSLVLQGSAVDNPTIATFMKRLQASPYFADVELVLSQQEGPHHKFTIKCKVQLPARGEI